MFLCKHKDPSNSFLYNTRLLTNNVLSYNIGCWGTRHTLVLLGFLGFANVYAMRVNLSVTIVAMVNHTAIPHINQTSVDICPEPPGTAHDSVVKVSFTFLSIA